MKNNSNNILPPFLARLIPWLVLVLISSYIGVYFIASPYLGFDFNKNLITKVYMDDLEIAPGDQILRIDGQDWVQKINDINTPLFQNYSPGDNIPFTIITENGEEKEISLVYQNFIQEEFYNRLNSQWWFTLFFWGAGTIIFLTVRPRGSRLRLLIAYMFLFSIFLASGSGPSRLHLFGSGYVMRISAWMLLPVTIHLHWGFPRQFKNPPLQFKKLCLFIAYSLSAFMLVFQFTSPEFYNLYVTSIAIGFLGTTILLLSHFIIQKDYRRDTQIVFYFSLIAILPFLIVYILQMFGYKFSEYGIGTSIIGLPLIPIAYVYTIIRRQLGKYELRANRAISLYFFTILLLILIFILSRPLLSLEHNQGEFLYLIFVSLSLGVFSIFAFQPFQRFIEKRILGMSYPPEGILHRYTSFISTFTKPAELANILINDILGSMLIRESALLDNNTDQQNSSWLYTDQVSPPDPSIETYTEFHKFFGKYLIEPDLEALPKGFEWVRMILPLQANDQTQGIWFLGRKDPDDYYSAPEIETLQSLANQTAIALANYQLNNSLRALYRVNIFRHEMERSNLGRELHDETLNHLAGIKQKTTDKDLREEVEKTIGTLRGIVSGLRPNMLNFGLMTALQELADEYNQRTEHVLIDIDLTGDMSQLEDELAEQQICRIIQQALDNALAHEECKSIQISGEVTQTYISLKVKDDGPGFILDSDFTLATLLEQKRFGLVGMYERSSVIYAKLNIETTPGEGTCISLVWKANDLPQIDI